MTNGLYKPTGWLRRVAGRCLGVGPRKGDATALMPPVDVSGVPLGQCDGSSLPQDTICVQDTSGSLGWSLTTGGSRLDASKLAAEAFFRRRAVLSPGDRIAIVTFNNYGRVVLPLTEITRLDVILTCLASLRVAGGTDLAEGLKAANGLFAQDVALNPALARYRRILLLTDGHGGNPLRWATHLKNAGVLLEVIGIGGNTSDVDEALLRRVATTDAQGLIHYWFFHDTDGLVAHYEDLANGLVFRGHG